MLVVAVGYWLFSTGRLDQIFGQLGASGGGNGMSVSGADGSDGGGNGVDGMDGADGADAYAGPGTNRSRVNQVNGEVDVDISGPNSGAMVNGKCYGSPEQCRRAQNLLEEIT